MLQHTNRLLIGFLFCTFIIVSARSQTNTNYVKQVAIIDSLRNVISKQVAGYNIIDSIADSSGYRHVYATDSELRLIEVCSKGIIDKYVQWFFFSGEMIYAEQTWNNHASGEKVNYKNFYLANGRVIEGSSKNNVDDSLIGAYGQNLLLHYKPQLNK